MPKVAKNAGSEPGVFHYAVTPSNTVPLTPVPRSLFVNANGILTIVDSNDEAVTYNVTAGQILPFRAIYINTDSTANVIAWY